MGGYLFDIIIVGLLALFAWRGAAKGLILSLCGLVAIFVAFFAAQFISEAFCAPVGNIIRPVIIQTVRGAEPEPPAAQTDEEQSGYSGYTLDELLEHIEHNGLFKGFSDFLEEGAAKNAIQSDRHLSPLEALSSYLARAIAKALLFGVVFFGVQLAWFLMSRALDLAFNLPILAQVNLAGGLIAGLVKGVLLSLVLVWLAQVAGFVPVPPETPVLSLFTVDKLWELLSTLPA